MARAVPETVSNRLIAGLARRQRVALMAVGETIELSFDEVLCMPGQEYSHVHFPVTACIALVAKVGGHPPLELGLIGNEGMLGVSLLLGVRDVPLRAVVQGPGSALRVPLKAFLEQAGDGNRLRGLLDRYLFVSMVQFTQSALCARFHEIGPRLARWLLLTHDRAHADHFHMTHQYLADMLGVQRSAVTIAAGELQARGLIQYSRGEIEILDRAGLELSACECYAASVEANARRGF